jgi:outer membrane protein OmpA-like peptidoglycan-associated protein/ABC-type nitrate/sulfonate/bicarbonate transport system substrate-binding protein
MNPKIIIIALIIVVLAVVGMVGFKLFDDADIASLTDSSKIKYTFNVGVDNWAGYTILCSHKARQYALDEGVLIKCHNDDADYDLRLQKLKDGELQGAALTVDGYVLVGGNYDFPGQIGFIIDESTGGDAIWVNSTVAQNINDLKTKSGVRVGYTPNSPSQTLLTAWSQHFDVPVNDATRFTLVKTNGSSDAFEKLKRGEIDVAVLWEPDVTRAKEDGRFVKLLGSEDVKNLIVDVLSFNERFIRTDPEAVRIVTASYFKAQEFYKANISEFDGEISDYTGIDSSKVVDLRDGINWIDLPHNGVDWLGISHGQVNGQRRLYDTIESAIRLYKKSGDLNGNPLPNSDPFRIINSSTLEQVFNEGLAGGLGVPFVAPTSVVDYSITRAFKKLSPGRWAKLREVGSLKIEPIRFRTGTAELDPPRQDAFSDLVDALQTYPKYRIKIVGHTGKRGDKAANMALSKQRSLTAYRYLIDNYGIDKNRIYAYGVGNEEPPVRIAGEKSRAYNARWPRVEIRLVEGE